MASECILALFPENLGPTSPLCALPGLVHRHAHHEVVDGGVLPHALPPGRGAASVTGRTAPNRGLSWNPLLDACPLGYLPVLTWIVLGGLPCLRGYPACLRSPAGPHPSLRARPAKLVGRQACPVAGRVPSASLVASCAPEFGAPVASPASPFLRSFLRGLRSKSFQTARCIGRIMLMIGKEVDPNRFFFTAPALFKVCCSVALASISPSIFLIVFFRPPSSSAFGPTVSACTSARNVCMTKRSFPPFPGGTLTCSRVRFGGRFLFTFRMVLTTED